MDSVKNLWIKLSDYFSDKAVKCLKENDKCVIAGDCVLDVYLNDKIAKLQIFTFNDESKTMIKILLYEFKKQAVVCTDIHHGMITIYLTDENFEIKIFLTICDTIDEILNNFDFDIIKIYINQDDFILSEKSKKLIKNEMTTVSEYTPTKLRAVEMIKRKIKIENFILDFSPFEYQSYEYFNDEKFEDDFELLSNIKHKKELFYEYHSNFINCKLFYNKLSNNLCDKLINQQIICPSVYYAINEIYFYVNYTDISSDFFTQHQLIKIKDDKQIKKDIQDIMEKIKQLTELMEIVKIKHKITN